MRPGFSNIKVINMKKIIAVAYIENFSSSKSESALYKNTSLKEYGIPYTIVRVLLFPRRMCSIHCWRIWWGLDFGLFLIHREKGALLLIY